MKKEKILILVPFPVYPPNNAGANRIFSLSKELSKHYDVVNYSQCVNKNLIWKKLLGRPSFAKVVVNNHYKIIQSYNIFYNFFLFLTSRINAQNFLASHLLNLYTAKDLEKEIKNASLVQVEQPWQMAWVKKTSKSFKIPVIFSCYGVEKDVLKTTIPNIPFKNSLINYLRKKELDAYHLADYVIFLSEDDKKYFEQYKPISKSCMIPMYTEEYIYHRLSKSLPKRKEILTVLFVGSNWKPNIEALKYIQKLAKENVYNKKLRFLVVGSVGENKKNTKNLIHTGRVDLILPYYINADIFINPVTIGSGINYKMIEAMAASLPIITTPFGTRGIKLINNNNAVICDLSQFKENIKKIADNTELREKFGKNARKLALKKYSKKNIVKTALNFYQKIFLKICK